MCPLWWGVRKTGGATTPLAHQPEVASMFWVGGYSPAHLNPSAPPSAASPNDLLTTRRNLGLNNIDNR